MTTRYIVPAVLAVLMSTAPLMAKDICHVPEADQRPVADLRSMLEAKGWKIANIKKEDGCYEVYAHDGEGKRVEIFFDPKTFEEMGSDD